MKNIKELLNTCASLAIEVIKNKKGLWIVELKDGESYICTEYYEYTNKSEYRLSVIYGSKVEECKFDYDVLKEEIENITGYSNSYLKTLL